MTQSNIFHRPLKIQKQLQNGPPYSTSSRKPLNNNPLPLSDTGKAPAFSGVRGAESLAEKKIIAIFCFRKELNTISNIEIRNILKQK